MGCHAESVCVGVVAGKLLVPGHMAQDTGHSLIYKKCYSAA